jgi:hypothetical protein
LSFEATFAREKDLAPAANLRLSDSSEKQTTMEWFLRQGSRVEGPLAEADLRARILAGGVARDAFVAPKGPDLRPLDFRPLCEWEVLSTTPVNPRSADRKGTALFVTDVPFLSPHETENAGRGTALLGTDSANPLQGQGAPPWPGAPQNDPSYQEAAAAAQGGAAAAAAAEAGTAALAFGGNDSQKSFFDTVSADLPLAPENIPELKNIADREKIAAAPRLLPVKTPTNGPLVAAAIALALSLGSLGAWAADRLTRGPAWSDISRYLPAGAPYYLEVPSVKRWRAGFGRMAFLRSEDRVAAEFLQSLSLQISQEPDTETRMRRFTSIDAFAVTQVEGHTLSAVHYETDEAMAQYLKALPQEAEASEWGKRYKTAGGHSCLWLEGDRVELCGKGGALDAAVDVLAGRAPSAEEDAYLKAAKKRPFWSYLPFAEVPAFYAVGNQTLFSESASADQLSARTLSLATLSLATLSGGLDSNGYYEKVDLVFRPGKAPRSLRPGTALTLWRALPEGTLFYANFHLPLSKNGELIETGAPSVVTLAPPLETFFEQGKNALGFHPAELARGLASEALVALTFPPEERLTKDAAKNLLGALWIHLTIADHTEVRRTLNALVERLSGEQSTLFWKDDNNLVGTLPSGLGVHLLLEKNLLRLGIGSTKELSRVFSSSKRLSDDLAHDTAVADLDQEISVLAWLDAGRLLSEPSFASALKRNDSQGLASLGQSITLAGPTRTTSAVVVRQFPSGDVRVRSRNFPTGFLLFSLLTLGQNSAESRLDTKVDAEPDIEPPPHENAPPRIGPGPDGTFRLPAP